ncbi:MAG: YebC/PmpR family DNA-binding transcriptional regulator [Patescibacteria group bacterium]|nr:YebC/PmpR family DNA-binding transcriptional regulator [Patescibacteria group bacterium]
MAGHSHWAGIKHKKEVTDKKRGAIFSKLLTAITVAARHEQSPDFNPRLRTAIEKARAQNVPSAHIERAITRARDAGESVEELMFEAYGPGGTALLIIAMSDNRNRTVSEVKSTLVKHEGKWAEPGSVQWAFKEITPGIHSAKFPISLSQENASQLSSLIASLEDHPDVQEIFTNAHSPTDT